MAERDVEKLLGGYAIGTLTDEERRALFEAALHDQVLFAALADEQALKDLLDDPVARRRVLAALRGTGAASAGRLARALDWFRRPANLALAGGLATLLLALVFGLRLYEEARRSPADELTTVQEPTAVSPGRGATREPASPAPVPEVREDQPAPARQNRLAGPPRAAHEPPTVSPGPVRSQSVPKNPQAERPAISGETTVSPAPEPGAPSRVTPSPSEDIAGFGELREGGRTAQTPSSAAPVAPRYREGAARALFYGQPSRRQDQPGEEAKEGASDRPQREREALADEAKKEAVMPRALAPESGRAVAPREPVAGTLGLRYSLLTLRPDGTFAEVDPSRPVARGEAWRLTVETNQAGYLYVLRQDSPREWTVLFPPSGHVQGAGAAHVAARTRMQIPPSGAFSLEGPTGQAQLVLVLARQPQPALERLVAEIGVAPRVDEQAAAEVSAWLEQAREETERLPPVWEVVGSAPGELTSERAVYVSAPFADERTIVIGSLLVSAH